MCVCVVVVVVCACGVVWHAENPRVFIQNVLVFTCTTPACGNTCGRGAGPHRDVLNVHTGGVLNVPSRHKRKNYLKVGFVI